jgi:polyhydroxybutyrate depolymerase
VANRVIALLALGSILILSSFAVAAEPAPTTFTIDGTQREALIFAPSSNTTTVSKAAPVVFAFHGHGGNMQNAARRFDFQDHWPEAIVVYMQGLPTPSKIDKEGKEPGWQHFNGQLDNRDLKFFDQVLVYVRNNYRVDDNRIYATGFSNGGAFTYFLWANRPAVFAAVAPMAGLPWPTEPPNAPKPAFIVAGENDKLVPIEEQQAMVRRIRDLNKAAIVKRQPQDDGTTYYESSISAPLITLIHPGGHELPPDATKLIVDFFKQHPPSP